MEQYRGQQWLRGASTKMVEVRPEVYTLTCFAGGQRSGSSAAQAAASPGGPPPLPPSASVPTRGSLSNPRQRRNSMLFGSISAPSEAPGDVQSPGVSPSGAGPGSFMPVSPSGVPPSASPSYTSGDSTSSSASADYSLIERSAMSSTAALESAPFSRPGTVPAHSSRRPLTPPPPGAAAAAAAAAAISGQPWQGAYGSGPPPTAPAGMSHARSRRFSTGAMSPPSPGPRPPPGTPSASNGRGGTAPPSSSSTPSRGSLAGAQGQDEAAAAAGGDGSQTARRRAGSSSGLGPQHRVTMTGAIPGLDGYQPGTGQYGVLAKRLAEEVRGVS